LLLNLVFARKPKTTHSLLWFAAIKCLERVKDPAGLAPQGSFIAAETIEREIEQVGQTQKAASELDIGSVGVFPQSLVPFPSYLQDCAKLHARQQDRTGRILHEERPENPGAVGGFADSHADVRLESQTICIS
jgi:hypothetical protein